MSSINIQNYNVFTTIPALSATFNSCTIGDLLISNSISSASTISNLINTNTTMTNLLVTNSLMTSITTTNLKSTNTTTTNLLVSNSLMTSATTTNLISTNITTSALSTGTITLTSNPSAVSISSGTQTIPNNTETLITIWSAPTLTGDITYSSGLFTVPTGGVYVISCDEINWTAGTTGYRYVAICNFTSGSVYIGNLGRTMIGFDYTGICQGALTVTARITSGQKIGLRVYQYSGGGTYDCSFIKFGMAKICD